MVISGFLVFLGLFVFVGLLSVRKSRGTRTDYYLASQGVKPWLVGLSAVATNNSGYMFIGVIGYTYATGLASIWLMIGWICGDWIASQFIHRNLRIATGATGEVTFAGVLSRWQATDYRWLRIICGAISFVFMCAYAAAQFMAGGKALHVLLDWPLQTGAIVGSILVVAYCFAGGLRASIWTDAVQSMVMMVAMATLLIAAVLGLGGIEGAWRGMDHIPGFLDWFPHDTVVPGFFGGVLFITGWLFAGFSVIGQPHIMVRFMALDQPEKLNIARLYYYIWFCLFYGMATGVGMLSRVYFPESGNFDAELALPMMAANLLPGFLVGVVLAGIFAATLSTADSLILSCSAALTHDLLPRRMESTLQIKGTTVAVTVLALVIALTNNQSVFNLVIVSWATLASSFAPLLLLYVLGEKPSERAAILLIITGLITALIWRGLELHRHIYEGMAGILLPLLFYFASMLWHRKNQ